MKEIVEFLQNYIDNAEDKKVAVEEVKTAAMTVLSEHLSNETVTSLTGG